MFPLINDCRKPLFKIFNSKKLDTLMHPTKLLFLLEKIEYSRRPFSKFNPHIQIDSEVLLKNLATGDWRRIRLVPPLEKETLSNAIPFNSQLGVALLGHKINHTIEYKEGEKTTLWKIAAINLKEKNVE